MTRRLRPHAGTLAVVTAVVVSVSFVAGLHAVPSPRDPILAAAPVEWSVPTSPVRLADERQVMATPVVRPGAVLTTGASGRVTDWGCTPGATVVSGSAVLAVDDRPIFALATSRPLWRDIGPGDEGDDVRAVQDELVRLGLGTSSSGVVDPATAASIDALLASAGVASADGVLATEVVVWVPASEVVVETCDVALGGFVVEGGQVATTVGSVSSIAVELPVAPGLVDGARTVSFAGVVADVPEAESGTTVRLDDGPLMDAVEASAEYTAWLESEGQTTMSLEYALRDPVDAIAVPPGSLFALDGPAACVRSDGRDHAVTIVASRLGQSLVRVDGELDEHEVLTAVDRAPTDASACR